MKQIILRGSLLAGALVIAVQGFGLGGDCHVDVADRVSNLEWLVELRLARCSAIGGTSTVVAQNLSDHHEYTVAIINDVDSEIGVAISKENVITVTMPNMIDIVEQRNKLENLDVIYKFLPYDNPEERRMYQFWIHHPDDPAADSWFKLNVEKKINGPLPKRQ